MKIQTKWNKIALYKITKDYIQEKKVDFDYVKLGDFCKKVCAIANKESKINKEGEKGEYVLVMNDDYFEELQAYLSKIGTTNENAFHIYEKEMEDLKPWVMGEIRSLEVPLIKSCRKSEDIEKIQKHNDKMDFFLSI